MKQLIKLKNSWAIKQITPAKMLSDNELRELCVINARNPEEWLDAQMPAQVHEILLKHNKISDEITIGLAHNCRWVAESDWIYRCFFNFNKTDNMNRRIYINFKGLDTIANIYLNGIHIAYHDDMYLPLRKDITDIIKDANVLLVHFHSPYEYIKEVIMPEEWVGKIEPFKLLRKPKVDFTDYLGAKPYLTPIGIYDDVVLEIVDKIEMTEVDIRTTLTNSYKEGIVKISVKGMGVVSDNAIVNIAINGPDKLEIVNVNVPIRNFDGMYWEESCELKIYEPELWWPREYGEQPLYEIKTEVYMNSECRDRNVKKIGFRDVKMLVPFDFHINGMPIKLWGANFAPIQGISHCWNPDRATAILDMVENANMNTLRIWGEGGSYPDHLYDETDRRGILLWQEFYHGYGMQPDNEKFRKLCRREAEYTVKRLKHRPSIIMWCGGNEGFLGGEYDHPGDKHIGSEVYLEDYKEICEQLDPDRFYHPNSPWEGAFANDPSEGDSHGYDTWWYVPGSEYPVMYSEYMRTSPPVLRSLKRFIKNKDLWPEGYVNTMKYGDKCPMPDTWMARTSAMMEKKTGPIELFYDADNPEELVYRFGAAHALVMRRAIERCRMGRASNEKNKERKCKGHLVWKLNDTWPQIYCAIIDYYLEPYIPYYAIKRAYSPILVCFDIRDHINLWVVNDSIKTIQGTVIFRLFNPGKNTVVKELKEEIKISAGSSDIVMNLDVLGQFRRENILYACIVNEKEEILSSTIEFVDIERHMTFPDAKLDVKAEDNKIIITTDQFARCVELSGNNNGDEFGWFFEDNYFDLFPGEIKIVKVLGRHKKGIIKAKAHYSKYETVVEYRR